MTEKGTINETGKTSSGNCVAMFSAVLAGIIGTVLDYYFHSERSD